MIELKNSGVEYIDSTHKYYYKGKELAGITGLLHQYVFPDMYSNVSQDVLKKAASKGTLIHEQVELYASLGAEPSLDSVKAFVELIREEGYEIVGSEYVIRIGEEHASAVDLVMHKKEAPENEIEIWDIKGTYAVNKEYVRWQNSIYKMGVEELNDNLHVTRICCMWLRDDDKRGTICRLIDLGEARPTDDVRKLFACEKNGCLFGEADAIPSYIMANEASLGEIEEKIAKLSVLRDELKASIFEGLKKDNITSYKTNRYTYSVKAGYDRVSLDTKAFDADDEELYDRLLKKYQKVTHIKESFQIKKV